MTDIYGKGFLAPLFLLLLSSAAISVYDIRHYRIPDSITISASIALIVYRSGFESGLNWLFILCGAVEFLILLAVKKLSPRGLGQGDVKAGFLCGLSAGPLAVFPGLLLSAFFCGIHFTILSLKDRTFSSRPLPFGPYLCSGTLVSLLAIPLRLV